MDMPAEVLYWTLTQAQRHDLAVKFQVWCTTDGGLADDCARTAVWLTRLRARGSIGAALEHAAQLHWYRLRHLEDTIRTAGAAAWRDELERYRTQYYALLAYREAA